MYATVTVAGLVMLVALLLPVETRACITSLLLLVVFTMINLALLRIKSRYDKGYAEFTTPRWGQLAGSLFSQGFLGYQLLAGTPV